mmetsp:Transcript_18804/g.29358  ORF Transcript_18804/g.29358 Transcript_18804/m.29358 type:complete len:100 (+) Transcript_18804:89-388(+)
MLLPPERLLSSTRLELRTKTCLMTSAPACSLTSLRLDVSSAPLEAQLLIQAHKQNHPISTRQFSVASLEPFEPDPVVFNLSKSKNSCFFFAQWVINVSS